MIEFHWQNEELISELTYCERFVRALFFSRSDKPNFNAEFGCVSPWKTSLRTVLANYIYDAYVRLVIADKSRYVIALTNVGTVLFLWSLKRIDDLSTNGPVEDRRLLPFSQRLNNFRRTGSLDILLPEAIRFLERAYQREQFREQAENETSDESLLARLKTYYDPEFESTMFDHSTHYESAFVPLYRFADSGQEVLNMSRYVGYTMRENIRKLYEYLQHHLGDRVCPCVVIFNFFIRDSYRMYYSKSLRQTSFVEVRRRNEQGEPDSIKLSYMIVTNLYPKVASWFKSINNQLIKKTGKMHIQHLDTFVRLLCQLNCQDNYIAQDDQVSVVTHQREKPTKRLVEKKKARAPVISMPRLSLSALYPIVSVSPSTSGLFHEMFSTKYRSCLHAHVARTYEQLRANDESATLIRMCLDCGQRL